MNRLTISVLLLVLTNGSEAAVSNKVIVGAIVSSELAAFENQRYLKPISTKDPLFEAATESGVVLYATPREYPVGAIYGQHLESIHVDQE